MKTQRFSYRIAMASWLLVLCVLLGMPSRAWARSYTVSTDTIDATVQTDGTLSVVEQRTYQFSGSFNGIYWEVPRGSFEGRAIDTQILAVGVVQNGQLNAFSEGSNGDASSYELSEKDDCYQLKLSLPVQDQTVVFQVAYQAPNLVSRWADTAELYWQYVPADPSSDVECQNITATVHLPVPSGEPVNPGENVRAWGHGPLDGEISFAGNDVVFYSPGVGTKEFLEARVTFPPSWLKDVPASEERRLNTILSEEEQWAQDANAKRRNARLATYGIPGLMILLSIGSVVAVKVVEKRRRHKGPKAQFQDTYYRDVPSQDHPAVLGMLYHDGHVQGSDFVATLMCLADQGRIGLDAVPVDKPVKKDKTKRVREWRLLRRDTLGSRLSSRQKYEGKAIDDAAYSFLFDVVGDKHRHAIDPQLLGPSGEPYVLTYFFDETAKGWPGAYEAGYNKWSGAVKDAYDKRGFEKKASVSDSLFPGGYGLLVIALGVLLAVIGMFAGTPNGINAIAFILCFATGIYCVMKDDTTPTITYSQEGMELRAKLEALKRWLCDFTRLEEAIPTDVVLWNRLLVMATVLGVAEQVVKQLKVYAPQLVEDPDLESYAWCSRTEDGLEIPLAALSRTVEKSHSASYSALHPSSDYNEVSSSSLSSSRDSSSRGSGGGFSSGGGGGFSGGGRGGAF